MRSASGWPPPRALVKRSTGSQSSAAGARLARTCYTPAGMEKSKPETDPARAKPVPEEKAPRRVTERGMAVAVPPKSKKPEPTP